MVSDAGLNAALMNQFRNRFCADIYASLSFGANKQQCGPRASTLASADFKEQKIVVVVEIKICLATVFWYELIVLVKQYLPKYSTLLAVVLL